MEGLRVIVEKIFKAGCKNCVPFCDDEADDSVTNDQ
jgi:Pyruvate/2-oxoacid:ferredoxin oxidoreductase delta subunit